MARQRWAIPRRKKIRPLVRVRDRVAKKGGKCAACKGRYEKGDEVTHVLVKRRVYHRVTCVPANAGQMPTPGAAPIHPTLPSTPGEAKMAALSALENALVVVAKHIGITPEMEKSFDRYNKLKGMALRPGSDNEGKQAMKFATIELVKVVFS